MRFGIGEASGARSAMVNTRPSKALCVRRLINVLIMLFMLRVPAPAGGTHVSGCAGFTCVDEDEYL